MRRGIWLVVLAACGRGDGGEPVGSGSAAEPTPITRIERRAETAEASGWVGVLTPRETIEVTAPFTSKVEKLYVQLGEDVAVDAPLVLLDARPLKDELATAKAAYKEASVASAAAASRYAREKRALKEKVASKADVDAAAFEASQAAAAVGQHKTKISQIEARLKDTRLTSTITGRVALRYVEEGARVTEGQPVVRVISSGRMFIRFAIPGAEAKAVAPGAAVEVRFDGLNLQGVVKTVAPELDAVSQMVLAEAELTGDAKGLSPGQVCRIVAASPK